ncbi:MAG: hypothetical protein RLZZ215_3021 [Pseudomonadota bacterium]|jgi:small nuclear ribonucleoprotein (snRNP)-like protein
MKINLAFLMLSAAIGLSSCGDALTLVEGGMTGTGITAGRITGFGSIYVNGIHYQVNDAGLYRNGSRVADQSSFAAGEFITVTGSVNTDGVSGIATQVSFDSLVKGVVEAITAEGQNQSLNVLGQTVELDLLTVLHGFDQLTDLQLGNVLEISGDRLPNGKIKASSIALIADSYQTTEGLQLMGAISQLKPELKTFKINGLTINYSTANLLAWGGQTLANGQTVQVKATQLPNNAVLIAQQLSLQTMQGKYPNKSHLELEGIVTALSAANEFSLAGQKIISSHTTQWIGLTAAVVGLNLEVEGYIDTTGTLQAQRIILRDVSQGNSHELAGQITAIDKTLNTISLAGYLLYLDKSSMLLSNSQTTTRQARRGGRHDVAKFEDLVIGDYIEVTALQLTDGTWRVLRLDRGGRAH